MSRKQIARDMDRERCMGIGLAVGMPSFALIGFLLCITTDNLGFLGLGPAIGLTIGIAIGEGLYQWGTQNGA
jgi:hypothetical protein